MMSAENGKHATAAEWFRKAAAQDHSEAQFLLVRCLLEAKGVAKDVPEAFRLLQKSAEATNVKAQVSLGLELLLGHECERNLTEGASWLRKAAENGSLHAMYVLGLCYQDGLGVDADEQKALA